MTCSDEFRSNVVIFMSAI